MDKLELNKLTPEQKRERIANICHPQFPTFWVGSELRHRYDHYTPPQYGPAFNYLHDLNAMASAEDKLNDDEHKAYRKALWIVTTGGHNDGYEEVADPLRRAFVSATAAQRAEAFLLAVNRGENNPSVGA